VNTNDIIIML